MDHKKHAKNVFEIEAKAIANLSLLLTEDFNSAVNCILNTNGRTIICGMGKSGIIGKKIAATFASTGTPSFFMHPGEAFHGDLGMVTSKDVFLAISNSGETEEVLKLLPFLKDNGNVIIAVTGDSKSTLARFGHYHLNIFVPEEACPLQLAPTSSTTATLAMGDALAVALMEARSFKPENFARFHPGGSLGRMLIGKVRDEMCPINNLLVESDSSISKVIQVISSGKKGLVLVGINGIIKSIITDGDLRRAIEIHGKMIFDKLAKDISKSNPVTILADTNIQVALDLMNKKSINALVVLENNIAVGLFKK